ncbi:hypothetical protein QBE52_06005 [Clostridiaceae bacterium 35-E11]
MYPMYPYTPMMDAKYYVMQVNPVVRYGLKEAKATGVQHAMTEVALISYLMGMGYDYQRAYALVESWEIDEAFSRK